MYRDRRRTSNIDGYKIIALFNVALLIGSIFYLIYSQALWVWNIYGVILLAIFVINLFLSIRSTKSFISYTYTLLSFFTMLALPFLNMGSSLDPGKTSSQNPLSVMMILSLLLVGAIQAANIPPKKRYYASTIVYRRRTSIYVRLLKGIPLFIVLLILSALSILAALVFKVGKDYFTEVVFAQTSMFFALAIWSLGSFIQKVLKERDNVAIKTVAAVITIFGFLAAAIPFAIIPFTGRDASRRYDEVFTNTYARDTGLRNTVFSVGEYFFGTHSGKYLLEEDTVYHEEDGLILKYDAYLPKDYKSSEPLPVLIRVHGGGWTGGNKGKENFAQVNKYFAAAGYAVFDIQYGISNRDKLMGFMKRDPERTGDFTIDDMVSHIGLFGQHLVKNHERYNGDLNKVFLSGGSAGGQLILAAGLGDVLGDKITVKGLIPFYPAVLLAEGLGLEGREEYLNPMMLIDENSPPCLIYHGKNDGFVNVELSEGIRGEYERHNNRCVLLVMPLAGHGSDLYFSGGYNQVFIYFMERFMREAIK